MITGNNRIKRIERINVYIIKLPLVKPFETSFSVQREREAIIIELISEGISGWGESVTSADPFYSYETNFTTLNILKEYLLPILKELKNFSINDFLNSAKRVRGYNMAKAAVENAILDLTAKLSSLPLYELIGGSKKRIMSGISIGIKGSTEELIDSIALAVEKKYHRIKIKIKKGKDVEIVKKVRKKFPDIKLMVDANSDYSLLDIETLKELDKYNLMMIEQPLYYYDIFEHSILQKELKTPICLDESIKNLSDVKTAIALGSCKIINIKQGRVGGILSSRGIARESTRNSIKVWSGGMLETGIGRAFNIHLQTLNEFTLPGDTSGTKRYFNEDIVYPIVELDSEGYISIPANGDGIGVEVIRERLGKPILTI